MGYFQREFQTQINNYPIFQVPTKILKRIDVKSCLNEPTIREDYYSYKNETF